MARSLNVFSESLDPILGMLERHRAHESASGIRFESKRLGTAAAHMGAVRLAAACDGITHDVDDREFRRYPGKLDELVDSVMTEAVRVQRKVRQLLASSCA